MKNPLKERLKQGKTATGTFIQIGHPDVTECLSRIGFDWLMLDAEHAPLDYTTLQTMMQAMNGSNCVPIVRPQWNDPVVIKRILDIGAYGVLVPWINSKEEAENAVRACRYPPQGTRGFGPRRAARFDPDYYKTANSEILIAVQIETEEAVNNIDGILSVDGVDAAYIGPWDLSISTGMGVPPDWTNPRYLKLLDTVLEAANRHGKPAGMFTTLDTIEWVLKKGFRFNTLEGDDSLLLKAAKMAVAKVNQIVASNK